MTLAIDNQVLDACIPSSYPGGGPYEPSIASTASSSQTSIFSDIASAQSSIASSSSDDFRTSQEDGRDPTCAQAHIQLRHQQLQQLHAEESMTKACPQQRPSYADVTSVPSEQRQHPRRCSLARNQKPPPLVRQAERKLNFVDNLVDSATQMVEVIWPLSMVPCRSEGSNGRGVLPLRTYIEETLRRSRTSYSTLQVALYYLVLIMPYVPQRDFTMEQNMDCPTSRALMCGRRMFLAALILASKYLQDRNYSAKAWSKMSGLRVCEINANERTFLNKINWKLHVAKPLFDRWTDVVLKYTPSMHPPSSPGAQAMSVGTLSWKAIIPLLTPELDTVPLAECNTKAVPQPAAPSPFGFASNTTPTPTRPALSSMHLDTTSQETTPTPATIFPPRFLEPNPTLAPPTPALARMGPLPTPQMTPSSVASSTPAVSVCGSRRPSISSAMSLVNRAGFGRCATDEYPLPGLEKYRPFSRRLSITSSASSRSSPESMVSDNSRASRSSSISSVTTVSTTSSCLAPSRINLARMATVRNARIPLSSTDVMEDKENEDIGSSLNKPIVITTEDDENILPDFSISEKKLHAPHRHSKNAPHHHVPVTSFSSGEKSRKRNRPPRGNRRSELQEEVRAQLEEGDVQMLDVIDISSSGDEDMASPTPAVDQATSMLRRSLSGCRSYDDSPTSKYLNAKYGRVDEFRAPQPPATLARRESLRVPLQKMEGKKRTCMSGSADLTLPQPPQRLYYGEVL